MYRISFYIPVSDAPRVKEAMFAAGAGYIGNYDRCSWECPGRGQFRPLDGSQPVIGNLEQVATVEELSIDMVCDEKYIKDALLALVEAHPYEVPAYAVWPVLTLEDFM